VVDPAQQKQRDQVFFGATVTYANSRGMEHIVTIVGVDEADLARGQISWISPMARALLKARRVMLWCCAGLPGRRRSKSSPSAIAPPRPDPEDWLRENPRRSCRTPIRTRSSHVSSKSAE